MSYIDRIKVQGTEYDVLDRRVRLADGQDFDYGELKQGGINKENGYTTGSVLRRSETYWPVIEGPVNVVMQNGLTGYIRLYDANKTMIDPGEGMPGSNTTNRYIVIAQNTTMTLTMKEYNPNTAYFRFYFSCGTEDNIGALVRENARIIPLQTVATSGEMQMLGDDVSDLKSALNDVVDRTGISSDVSAELSFATGRYISSSGNLSSQNADWAYTDYFPVNGYGKMQITVPKLISNVGMYLAFYTGKSTSDYLSQVKVPYDKSMQGITYSTIEVDIPATAKYFRASWFSSTGQYSSMFSAFCCVLNKLGRLPEAVATLENNDTKNSANISVLNDINKIGVSYFSVAAGTEHSSANDKIDFSLSDGEEFDVYVKCDHTISDVRIFGYADSGTRIANGLTMNTKYTLTSNGDYTSVGVFFAAQDNDCKVTFVVSRRTSGNEIESYYANELADTIEKVRAVNDEPAIVFPWVTDIHRFKASTQTFSDMVANIKSFAGVVKCDFILNSGDTIEGNQQQDKSLGQAYDSISAMKEIGEPLYYVNGNHDNNPYISSGALVFTLKQIFGGFFAATKNVFCNVNENGTDYYFDFDNLDVRFICINSCNPTVEKNYGFGSTTAAWLSSALDTDNVVILVSHVSPIKEHVWNNVNPGNADDIRSALASFVSGGGKLILLTGHSHVDAEFVNPYVEITDVCQKFEKADTSTSQYLAISGQIDGIRNPDRTANTYTADAWSVCVYKPCSHELDLIRFGAGVDRYVHCEPVSSGTLTARLTPETWSSSDTSVATVSNGTITRVGAGRCAVIAKDAGGNIEVWVVEET